MQENSDSLKDYFSTELRNIRQMAFERVRQLEADKLKQERSLEEFEEKYAEQSALYTSSQKQELLHQERMQQLNVYSEKLAQELNELKGKHSDLTTLHNVSRTNEQIYLEQLHSQEVSKQELQELKLELESKQLNLQESYSNSLSNEKFYREKLRQLEESKQKLKQLHVELESKHLNLQESHSNSLANEKIYKEKLRQLEESKQQLRQLHVELESKHLNLQESHSNSLANEKVYTEKLRQLEESRQQLRQLHVDLESKYQGLQEKFSSSLTNEDNHRNQIKQLKEHNKQAEQKSYELKQALVTEVNLKGFFQASVKAADFKLYAIENSFSYLLSKKLNNKLSLIFYPITYWLAKRCFNKSSYNKMLALEAKSSIDVIFDQVGLEQTEFFIRSYSTSISSLSTKLMQLSKLVEKESLDKAIELAEEAVALTYSSSQVKKLGFLLFEKGELQRPYEMISQLPKNMKLSTSEKNRIKLISGFYQAFSETILVPSKSLEHNEIEAKKGLYVVSSLGESLMPKKLASEFLTLLHVTWDGLEATINNNRLESLEGVVFLEGPNVRKIPLNEYFESYTNLIIEQVLKHHSSVILAQPVVEMAIPALHAARKLGIPFVYDLSAALPEHIVFLEQEQADTEVQRLMQKLHAHILQNATQVIRDSNEHLIGYKPVSQHLGGELQKPVEPINIPAKRNSFTQEEKLILDQKLLMAASVGEETIQSFLSKQCEGHNKKFTAFCYLKAAAACLKQSLVLQARSFIEQALDVDRSASTLMASAKNYFEMADLVLAEKTIQEFTEQVAKPKASEQKFIDMVQGYAELVELASQPASTPTHRPVKGSVFNVLAFSLPYTSVGYATRSHGLAMGIANAGWDIKCFTRPGFPYDHNVELEGQTLPDSDIIDGIPYHRHLAFNRNQMSEIDYLKKSIQYYVEAIQKEQPEIVHAASNYVTALPALIAARKLGVPFCYEMRGFWEVTRSSRDPSFVHTRKYRLMQLFEGVTSKNADAVITITTPMKEELIKNGVQADKISIAYNSVDIERFTPSPKDQNLAAELGIPANIPVIGYIGSFVDYEGLDDLITACQGLNQSGIEFRLLLVGDGAVFDALQNQVKELDLSDKVILTGRVPHESVEEYYSLIDIAPFPRKPWKVCELVSPLKPYEAMALKKAVIASNTRALEEIIKPGQTGYLFEKGNVQDLQDKLEEMLLQPKQLQLLGENARQWVEKERSWGVASQVCVKAYENTAKNKFCSNKESV